MTITRDIDNRIRLNKVQAKALEAVVTEHQQTHRGVPIIIVQAYCNAQATVDQDRVLKALATLRRLKLVHIDGQSILPEPGCMERLHPEAAPDDEPAAAPERDAPPNRAAEDLPPVRPKSRDTLRPSVGGAPKPVTRPQPAEDRLCDGRPMAEPASAPVEQVDTLTTPVSGPAPIPPAIEYPASVERIHPEEGVTIPPELFNRCTAMHLTLLEQAREDYAQGNQGAGQELRWLIETGEQLLAAGGGA